MMPAWWAAEMASRISRVIAQAVAIAMAPPWRMRAASVWPFRNSITRNGEPSRPVPRSETLTMFSWPMRDAAIASRWNRSIMSGICASSRRSTLMATCFCSFVWVPTYTAPMPPTSSSWSRRYFSSSIVLGGNGAPDFASASTRARV